MRSRGSAGGDISFRAVEAESEGNSHAGEAEAQSSCGAGAERKDNSCASEAEAQNSCGAQGEPEDNSCAFEAEPEQNACEEVDLMSIGVECHIKGRRICLWGGESVWGPMEAPDFSIQPNAEQEKGTYYLAAGGARLPNFGEKHVRTNAGGKRCKIRLQVAKVRKPLLSVGRVFDKGNRVIFDRAGEYVQHIATGEKVYHDGGRDGARAGFLQQGRIR